MGAIRDKMKADLELRGCALTTQSEYLRRAHNFVAFHGCSPTEWARRRFASFCFTS
jgi:hypothetical protein